MCTFKLRTERRDC